MQHRGTRTLETDRLLLRRFEMGDAEAMYAGWAQDAEGHALPDLAAPSKSG